MDSYKTIRYKEDAADACAVLRAKYPNDAEVGESCAGVAAAGVAGGDLAADAPPTTTGPPKPPASATPPTA